MLNVKDNKTMMYTDLAVEIQEECSGRQGEIPGVVLEQYKEDGKGIRVTKIQIQTADGAKRMGRPIGNYMTLESAVKNILMNIPIKIFLERSFLIQIFLHPI